MRNSPQQRCVPEAGIAQIPEEQSLLDVSIGQPAASLRPVHEIALAAACLSDWGPDALGYGANGGPRPARELIARRWGTEADQVTLTAGASHALDLIADTCAAPGDGVLVESPTYDLAIGVLRQRRLVVHGLARHEWRDADAVDAVVRRAAAAGSRIRMAYVMSTFHNPTGEMMPAVTRQALDAVARRHSFMVVEDDVYTELAYDEPPPPSLHEEFGEFGARVVRLGSTSKTIGPGLRLGWIASSRQLAAELHNRAVFRSGGGMAHVAALIFTSFGGYDEHLARVRLAYRERRDALVRALRVAVPECNVHTPPGGFFLWLRLPDRADEAHVVSQCKKHGVLLAPGARFHVGRPSPPAVRLAFCGLKPAELTTVAEIIGTVLTEVHG